MVTVPLVPSRRIPSTSLGRADANPAKARRDDDLEFFYEHSDPEVEGEHVETGARLLAERIKTEEDAVKAEWTSRFTMFAIQDYYRRIHSHMERMAA